MVKPFHIQSPEQIAKEYGGNKQKIAQAMQMGVVDSTAGVLAGMFIDRIRSAQTQEQQQQPTVAQQIMGGAPPAQPPAGGMGAPPQGAPPQGTPPMPPQGMGAPPMPPAPPQGAPMGMAGGGLASLPIPDTMFDESTNGGFDDGYAGGGLIAFALGGETDPMGWLHGTTVRGGQWGAPRSYGGHTGLDLALPEGNPVGAVAPGQVVDAGHNRQSGNYVIVQHPDGHRSSYAELASIGVKRGDTVGQGSVLGTVGSTGATSTGSHVHFSLRDPSGKKIDPTPYVRGQRGFNFGSADGTSAPLPNRSFSTADGRFGAPMDIYKALQQQFGETPEEKEINTARMARARELASDEYQNKIRKEDMWNMLAQIGFNMASSKSPYLLQAVGEAAAAALPGAQIAQKERRALKDRALDAMGAMNGLRRKDNLALFSAAVDMAKAGQQQQQFETTSGLQQQEIGLRQQQLQQQKDLETRRLDIEDYRAKHPGLSDLESGTNFFLESYPNLSRAEALAAYMKLRQSTAASGTGMKTPEEIAALAKQRGGAQQPAPAAGPWTQYQQ